MMLPATLFSVGLQGQSSQARPKESNLEGMPLFPEQYLPGRDGERQFRTREAWGDGENASCLEAGLVLFSQGTGA